jgi:hypothetical protein
MIEAVYRSEVEKLAAAGRRFAETMTPLEALRAWMLLFVDHIAEKQIKSNRPSRRGCTGPFAGMLLSRENL